MKNSEITQLEIITGNNIIEVKEGINRFCISKGAFHIISIEVKEMGNAWMGIVVYLKDRVEEVK